MYMYECTRVWIWVSVYITDLNEIMHQTMQCLTNIYIFTWDCDVEKLINMFDSTKLPSFSSSSV